MLLHSHGLINIIAKLGRFKRTEKILLQSSIYD